MVDIKAIEAAVNRSLDELNAPPKTEPTTLEVVKKYHAETLALVAAYHPGETVEKHAEMVRALVEANAVPLARYGQLLMNDEVTTKALAPGFFRRDLRARFTIEGFDAAARRWDRKSDEI